MLKRFLSVFSILAACSAAVADAVPVAAFAQGNAKTVYVTESVDLSLVLEIPPLPAPNAHLQPVDNRQPVHLEAPFLAPQPPTAAVLGTCDANTLLTPLPGNVKQNVFTLNDYQSNDPFAGMPDPFAMLNGGNPFAAASRLAKFPMKATPAADGGMWRYDIKLPPFKAQRTGTIVVDGVSFNVPVIEVIGKNRIRFNERRVTVEPFTLTVLPPPEENRPRTWCGAIGSSLTVEATLGVSVCTVGEPLMLTLTLGGDVDFERVRAPALASFFGDTAFRVDDDSVKSVPVSAGRRYTYRVRPLRAGTFDIPAIAVARFDVAAGRYFETRTQPIPVQVNPGAIAAIGETEAEDDSFPMPDGLDLDFPDRGSEDFTFKRAISLALNASNTASFSKAANAYASFLDGAGDRPRDEIVRHRLNLAGLLVLADRPEEAQSVLARVERVTGETDAVRRTLRAARAAALKDPRAEIPAIRLMLPFWFRLNLVGRILSALGAVLVLVLIFAVTSKLAHRVSVVLLCCALSGATAEAAPRTSFMIDGSSHMPQADSVAMRLELEPAVPYVDEMCYLRAEIETDRDQGIDNLRFDLSPEAAPGRVAYDEWQILPNRNEGTNRVVHVYRLPVRFESAGMLTFRLTASGYLSTVRRTGNATFRSASGFTRGPVVLNVRAKELPPGKPETFSGAVGDIFRISARYEPERVRIGTLVTARYTLTYNGYVPTNTFLRIENRAPGFRTYPIQEAGRTAHTVVWEQKLVPTVTNAVVCGEAVIDVFDRETGKYKTVRSNGKRLVYDAAAALSATNATIVVNAADSQTTQAPTGTGPLTLRFAPSDVSPIVVTVPSNIERNEIHRRGTWRRISTPLGTGWTR